MHIRADASDDPAREIPRELLISGGRAENMPRAPSSPDPHTRTHGETMQVAVHAYSINIFSNSDRHKSAISRGTSRGRKSPSSDGGDSIARQERQGRVTGCARRAEHARS